MSKQQRKALNPNIAMIPVLLGVFFAADDQTVVVTILPQIMFDLRVEITELDRAAWTITGYLLGYVAIMPIMGRLSDVFERRTVYVASMVIFMIGSAGTGLTGSGQWLIQDDLTNPLLNLFLDTSSTMEWVIATRILQAVGAGALVPISIAMVGDLFPSQKRGVPLGLTGAAAEAGAVIGPLWGGIITHFLAWQWIFWLNLPISIVVLILLSKTFPQIKRSTKSVDYLGAFLIVAGLSFLTLGCSQAGNPNVTMYTYLITGFFSIIGYWFWATRVSDPLIPVALFQNLGFLASNMVHLLYGAVLIITLVTVPLMANTILQSSPLDGGLILARLTVAIPVGAVCGGILCRKLDLRIPSMFALLLCAAALFLMATWDEKVTDPTMTIHLVTGGLGFGLLIAPVTLTALNSAAETMKGAAAGVISTSRFLGMTLGVATLAAWGTERFQNLLSGITLPIPTKDETALQITDKTSRFQAELTDAGLSLFGDFYTAAAIICLIAILPCLRMRPIQPSS